MDPHVSHLVRPVTEYSATQGSSGFSCGHLPGMDAVILLLALKQGTRLLERYIAEYLALANGSELPDCILIDFFCDGLNQTVRSKVIPQGPRSSWSNFLDYVLLTVGSAFTVGVTEERDTALNCMITAALEHAHKMVATIEPVHKMAATTTPRHVIAASHESIQVTVDVKELSKVTIDRHESLHVSALQPESLHVSALQPESLHVSALQPESLHVSALQPESVTPRDLRSVLRVPCLVSSVRDARLVSSVRDAPLVSARAAGIPEPTHFSPPVPELIPLPVVLPTMGIALWCIWAAYTTSELPQVMAPAAASPEVAAHAAEPPEAAVLASAPCMVVAPSNVLSACHVMVKGTVDEHCTCPVTELYLCPDATTVEPPEVAASAAEPPEVSVVPSYESLSCPVTAMEAICESSFCPFTAKEAICELLPCSELAMEAVNVPSISLVNPVMNPGTKRPFNVCPVNPITDKITTHELSVCSISSNVSELSVRPVLVIEPSVVPSICPASINRSEYELSVLPVSVTELPTPASVNAPGYEHTVCTKVAFESDVELSVCFK